MFRYENKTMKEVSVKKDNGVNINLSFYKTRIRVGKNWRLNCINVSNRARNDPKRWKLCFSNFQKSWEQMEALKLVLLTWYLSRIPKTMIVETIQIFLKCGFIAQNPKLRKMNLLKIESGHIWIIFCKIWFFLHF